MSRLRTCALFAMIGVLSTAPSASLVGQDTVGANGIGAAAPSVAPPAERGAHAGPVRETVLYPLAAGVASAFALPAALHPQPLVPVQSVGPNMALMAVGGAALVIGLVIGGDAGMVIAATGGVIGLVGLYRYLR